MMSYSADLRFDGIRHAPRSTPFGEVSERLKEPVSKTGVRVSRTMGSNPILSAYT